MKIAVIGAGNMVKALLLNAQLEEVELTFYTPSVLSAKELAKTLRQNYTEDLNSLVQADAIFLAFKPQNLNSFAADHAKLFYGKKVLSILAGISIDKLANFFKTKEVLRIMPNLHSEYSLGYNLFSYSKNCTDNFKTLMSAVFTHAGAIYECSTEEELDSLTLFSASSPAFFYHFLSILDVNTNKFSSHFDDSKKMLINLLRGCASTLEATDLSYTELISKVASKGGVTQKAIDSLNQNDVAGLYEKSFAQAVRKIEEFKNS